MNNIFEDLAVLGLPVYVEGDAPTELPNEYYVISEDDSDDNLNASNTTLEMSFEYTLKFYTKDASNVYTGLINAIKVLKGLGYLIGGLGYAAPKYHATWYGRQVDVTKIEYID